MMICWAEMRIYCRALAGRPRTTALHVEAFRNFCTACMALHLPDPHVQQMCFALKGMGSADASALGVATLPHALLFAMRCPLLAWVTQHLCLPLILLTLRQRNVLERHLALSTHVHADRCALVPLARCRHAARACLDGAGSIQARLKWRPHQPLTLLELRARRREPGLALPARDEFLGCFSWVDVGKAAAVEARDRWARGAPALPDDVFASRQAALRGALAGMDAQVLWPL